MSSDPDYFEALATVRTDFREPLPRLSGPLLGGELPALALGHRSAASLRQAKRRGQETVPLVIVPTRLGWFALTLDVADWLAAVRTSALTKEGGASHP